MKITITRIGLIALLAVVAGSNGCLEDKVIQVVLSDEACAEFLENHTSANWNTPVVLDYGEEVDDILDDNGYSRGDIESASLVAGFYGVTEFSQSHDWIISGSITVRRLDGGGSSQVTIVDYSSESVAGLLGQKKVANLNAAGVALINEALADFIAGENPVLEFEVQDDGTIQPTPTPENPIVFTWKAWLKIQVILSDTVEDVPDPF